MRVVLFKRAPVSLSVPKNVSVYLSAPAIVPETLIPPPPLNLKPRSARLRLRSDKCDRSGAAEEAEADCPDRSVALSL